MWRICVLMLVLFLVGACSNENGSDYDPAVTKYQDEQIDGNTSQSGNIRADYPKVAMSGFPGGTTRIFVAWLDHRRGERNVFFNYKDTVGIWAHPSDLQIDRNIRPGMFADELEMACGQDGNYVHVVWADQRKGKEAIWYNGSKDGGNTFQEKPICLSPHWPFQYPGSEPHIQCSLDGTVVYVAWRYGTADVVMCYSIDGGTSWSSYSNYSDRFYATRTKRGAYISRDISLDCSDDGRYCHVAWRGQNCQIYYRCWDRLTNGGDWMTGEEVRVSGADNEYGKKPQVVCTQDGSTAYIVWRMRESASPNKYYIAFRYTANKGLSWTPAQPGPPEIISGTPGFDPNVYCNRSNGNLCVVWEEFDHKDAPDRWTVRARARKAGAWQGIQEVGAPVIKNGKHFVLPQVCGNGESVYVAWVDVGHPPHQYVYFNFSNDGGAFFDSSTRIRISTPGGLDAYLCNWPSIAVNLNDEVYVVWGEKRGNNIPNVFGSNPFACMNDERIPHHTPVRLHGWEPYLCSSGNNVYAIWLDDRHGAQDVFSSYSRNNGTSWSAPININPIYGEYCRNNQISCDSEGNVYIAWEKRKTADRNVAVISPATELETAHTIGEEVGEILFQRYYYEEASGRLSSHEARAYSFNENIEHKHLDGYSPTLTHNNKGLVYMSCDRSSEYPKSTLDFYLSRDRGITWEWYNNLDYTNFNEMLHFDSMADGDYFYNVHQTRRTEGTDHQSDIVFFWLKLDGTYTYSYLDLGPSQHSRTSLRPKMAKEGNQIFVAWTEFQQGDRPDVFFNYSGDNGLNWRNPAGVLYVDSSDYYASGDVDVAAGGDGVFYTVWNRYDVSMDRFDVLFKSVSIQGSGGEARVLNTGPEEALNPQISCHGNMVFVVWQDARYGRYDILGRYSLDKGRSWSQEIRFNTNAAGSSFAIKPQITVYDRWAYVLWEDSRVGKNVFFEARKQ